MRIRIQVRGAQEVYRFVPAGRTGDIEIGRSQHGDAFAIHADDWFSAMPALRHLHLYNEGALEEGSLRLIGACSFLPALETLSVNLSHLSTFGDQVSRAAHQRIAAELERKKDETAS